MLNQDTPSPCNTFSCENEKNCADNKVACESFVVFVRKGRTFPPNAIIRKRKVITLDRIYATNEIYNSVFPGVEDDEE